MSCGPPATTSFFQAAVRTETETPRAEAGTLIVFYSCNMSHCFASQFQGFTAPIGLEALLSPSIGPHLVCLRVVSIPWASCHISLAFSSSIWSWAMGGSAMSLFGLWGLPCFMSCPSPCGSRCNRDTACLAASLSRTPLFSSGESDLTLSRHGLWSPSEFLQGKSRRELSVT